MDLKRIHSYNWFDSIEIRQIGLYKWNSYNWFKHVGFYAENERVTKIYNE